MLLLFAILPLVNDLNVGDEFQDKVRMVQADVSTSSADDQNDGEIQKQQAMIETQRGAAPVEVLRDFQQYQVLKRQHMVESATRQQQAVVDRCGVDRCGTGVVDGRTGVVPGIAGHYAMRHGMQYYRDLAGNVKQVIHTISLSINRWFLRMIALSARARICYLNSVCPPVCHNSVPIPAQLS